MPKSKFVPFVEDFSAKECDRRWKLAKEFMQSNGLDAMLFVGTTGESYLTNWVPGCTLLFPLKSAPILLCSHNAYLLRLGPDTPKEMFPWVKEVRQGGPRGAFIIQAIKDRGLERAHIGVIGLAGTGGTPGAAEGGVSHATWYRVENRLPDCKFEAVAVAWDEAIAVKSEEELANVRRGAKVLELASEAMLKATHTGASELDVWEALSRVESHNGMWPRTTQFGATPYTMDARTFWLHGVGKPRILQPGDICETEIHADSRGYSAQVQMCVAVPPVSDIDKKCAEIARASYEAGLKLCRPGKTFEEMTAAMEEVVNKAGAWHMTPLIHSMNPHNCTGPTGVNVNRIPRWESYPQFNTGRIRGAEVVLKPGMVFELEPNACLGTHRINIGGTVLVTENEPEELNHLPNWMQVAAK
ncbi:MAG: aminopeptidase P family protein [Chloroflexi bacterium]|nr:aminopeptidase P family protein [Chloroflexota bacterium]